MHKILIISDNESLARLLRDFLLQADFDSAISVPEKALTAAADKPEIIIAELEQPDALFESLVNLAIPLIVLSPDRSLKRIAFLERGADDLVAVPFDAREVVARTNALIRRCTAQKSDSLYCALDGLIIDLHTYTITCEGKQLILPAKDTELLFTLASHPERVYRRSELIRDIWHSANSSERTVDISINRLRKAIADLCEWELTSVRGVGYKLSRKN